MATNFEQLADKLSKSPDHRILRRLPILHDMEIPDGAKVYGGIYLDCETTGLNVDKDEIIELAAVPFKFTDASLLPVIGTAIHGYNEPSIPITDEITALTGVTNEMVKGHKLDVDLYEQVLSETDLIVAHNSRFDRQMIERYVKAASVKCWGCSMEEVPWPKRGKRLEYIVQDMGYFYEAHSAIDDCLAGLFALRQQVGNKLAFEYLLEAARASTWHVWTVGLKYNEDVNELLKKQKYQFNNGDDGRPKAWHRAISLAEDQAELAWLQKNAYGNKPCSARLDKVNAFSRYSKRE